MFFLHFLVLISPLIILTVLLLFAVERMARDREVRRMKRDFREAYMDWRRGNPTAHAFARQWHHRLARLGK